MRKERWVQESVQGKTRSFRVSGRRVKLGELWRFWRKVRIVKFQWGVKKD